MPTYKLIVKHKVRLGNFVVTEREILTPIRSYANRIELNTLPWAALGHHKDSNITQID